jgi:hypothetical protein
MRTAWLVPLLFISLPPACSDDQGDEGDTGGSGGANAGGSAGAGGAGGGSGAAGAAGSATAGSGAGGSAGSGAGGSAGSGAGGSAGSGGAAGSSASGDAGCEGLCARPLVCPGDTRANCLSTCADAVELCPDETEALLRCSESLSDSDFQCVGDNTIPNDDVCVSESGPFLRCLIGF